MAVKAEEREIVGSSAVVVQGGTYDDYHSSEKRIKSPLHLNSRTDSSCCPGCCASCAVPSRDDETTDEIVDVICGVSTTKRSPTFTMCQVRQHNTLESAWLVAGDAIYDATEYMGQHPGGTTSILKKAGGLVDCTQDLYFHSKSGRQMWEKYKVGRLVPCPHNNMVEGTKPWWQLW